MDNKRHRLKRLKRLVNLQRQLKRLHQWKLAELQFQKQQVIRKKTSLVETLDQPQLIGERLIDILGRQLSNANQKGAMIDMAKLHQRQQHEDQHRKSKHVEKVHETASGDYRRDAQGKELAELVDLSLQSSRM